MRSARLVRRTAVLAAAGLVVLSGCALQPGVAVDVAGTTVAASEVDELSDDVCTVEGPSFEQPLAVATVKALVIQALVDEQLAQRVARTYDVGPGPQFGDQLREVAQQYADAPEAAREGYLRVIRAAAYSQAILGAAASVELQRAGQEVTEQSVAQASANIRTLAARDADIDVDARYGFTYVDGVVTPESGASVPTSTSAVAGAGIATGAADPSYVASLPDAQVCGR